jgi:hypothetical protein
VKAILSGIVVALAVAVLAALVLNESQRTSYEVYTAHQSVRLGDPGNNLTGSAKDAEL